MGISVEQYVKKELIFFSIFGIYVIIQLTLTAWIVSEYGVIPGPYFPVFELNTEIYNINLRIQSEYQEDTDQK